MGYLCLQATLIILGTVGPQSPGEVLNLITAALGASILTIALIRHRVPFRRGWHWVAIAGWVLLGAAISSAFAGKLRDAVQLSSPATTVLGGLARILLAAGLLQLSRRGASRKMADSIDAWIAAVVGFLLLWVTGLDVAWLTGSIAAGPIVLLIGALFLVASAVQLIFATRVSDPHIGFVLLGTVALIGADVVIIAPTIISGGPFMLSSVNDLLWPWFPALAGAAALVPGLAESPQKADRGRDLAPGGIAFYVFLVVLVPALLSLEYVHLTHRLRGALAFMVPAAASAVLLLLLVGRLALVARISHNRAQQLDRRTVELAAAMAKQHQLQQLLHHQATHDPLTGLANRVVLVDRLEQLADADPPGRHALLLLDLDGFKGVNDTLGHRTGDALLAEVAQRLTRTSPDEAVVARLGGDEFAVLLVDTTVPVARAVASRLQATICRPMLVGGHRVVVTTSIGVAAIQPRRELTLSDIIHEADEALYLAKAAGRNHITVV